MFNFLSSLFNLKSDNQSLLQSKLDNHENKAMWQKSETIYNYPDSKQGNNSLSEAEAEAESNGKSSDHIGDMIDKKQELILMDVLKQTIASIDLKSYIQNSKDISLLNPYQFVAASDEFKKLFNLYKFVVANDEFKKSFEQLAKQFKKEMNFAIVAGKVKLHDKEEPKDHIWMIIGFERKDNLYLSYDFIYNQSEKFADKLIIDLQPLLDDVNNDVLILEYNSHPEYRPYGKETITNIDEYFQSKLYLKDITLYQPKEYEYEYGRNLYLAQDEDFFQADIVLFLLDSDFIEHPHRYVNIMDNELFKQITKIVHRLHVRLNSSECLYIKHYLVSLLIHNEQAKFISNNCLVMFR